MSELNLGHIHAFIRQVDCVDVSYFIPIASRGRFPWFSDSMRTLARSTATPLRGPAVGTTSRRIVVRATESSEVIIVYILDHHMEDRADEIPACPVPNTSFPHADNPPISTPPTATFLPHADADPPPHPPHDWRPRR